MLRAAEFKLIAVDGLIFTNFEDPGQKIELSGAPLALFIAGMLDSVDLMERLISIAPSFEAPASPSSEKPTLKHAAVATACMTDAIKVGTHLRPVFSDCTTWVKEQLLLIIAYKGHARFLPFLFHQGSTIDINGKDPDHTPVQLAAWNGKTDTALWLLEHAQKLRRDKHRRFMASSASCPSRLSRQLSHAAHPLTYGSATEIPILHYAILQSHMAITRLLMSHGARLEQPDQDHYAPLHYAVALGKMAMYDLLVSAGADPHMKGSQRGDIAPLHLAVALGRLNMVKRLHPPVDPAAELPYPTMSNGTTLLMLGCFYGRIDVVEWLLEHAGWGPHVGAADAKGLTALKYCGSKLSYYEKQCSIELPSSLSARIVVVLKGESSPARVAQIRKLLEHHSALGKAPSRQAPSETEKPATF
ncbi:hypothetical protein HDU96_001585 [Phlyctochytrium bullatum]|nr:hypothetical protein HDU96_001585 [Phlyctochytrium bullatum]